jgi:hypothetical protein
VILADQREVLGRQEILVLLDQLELPDHKDHRDQKVDLKDIPVFRDLQDFRDFRDLQDFRDFKDFRDFRDLQVLQLIKADFYHPELQHLVMFHLVVILQVSQRLLFY